MNSLMSTLRRDRTATAYWVNRQRRRCRILMVIDFYAVFQAMMVECASLALVPLKERQLANPGNGRVGLESEGLVVAEVLLVGAAIDCEDGCACA